MRAFSVEIPFQQHAKGAHDGFLTLLSLRGSNEIAGYFDLRSGTIRDWRTDKWVPIKHWHSLERMCAILGRSERIPTFCDWARQAGCEEVETVEETWAEHDVVSAMTKLRKFAIKLLGKKDAHAVDDAVQHAIESMITHGVKNLSYGMSAVFNYSLQNVKNTQKRDLELTEQSEGEASEKTAAWPSHPDDIYGRRNALALVFRAAAGLPKYLRESFTACVCEMDYDEEAAVFGISERSAASRRAGMRVALKRLIEDGFGDLPDEIPVHPTLALVSSNPCSDPLCLAPVLAKGLCKKHYMAARYQAKTKTEPANCHANRARRKPGR